jgi:hypothetical protein
MPRAGHIRAWPLPKMLPSGPSAPSPDALHLHKLWRVVSVITKRRALLLIVLPSARTPRCSVREKRPVMLRPVGGGTGIGARAIGRILIFDQLLIRVNERLRPASFGMRRASVPGSRSSDTSPRVGTTLAAARQRRAEGARSAQADHRAVGGVSAPNTPSWSLLGWRFGP